MTAPEWDRYPRWVTYFPAVLGALWLVGAMSWFVFSRLSIPTLTPLGKGRLVGLWLAVMVLVVAAFVPSSGGATLRSDEIADMWRFVRGPAPVEPSKKTLWAKVRRLTTIWFIGATLVLALVVASMLGLTHVR